MIYGAILSILLGVLAYIQHLKNLIQKHEQENIVLKTQSKVTEWDKQINESKAKVTEEEKDYDQERDDFHTKYGTSTDSKPSSDGKS